MTGHTRWKASRFHPDLRAASRFLPASPVTARTLPLIRRLSGRISGDGAFVESVVSETAAVRVYRPRVQDSPSPALLWIHGGGLVIGAPEQDEAALKAIADEVGATVALVRYRLAPEHRFPSAMEDCYAALTWLAAQEFVDDTRIAVGGASAGGGLAAATVLAARDRPGVEPCFQLLVYPMLDDRTATRVDTDSGVRRLWSNRANHLGWSSYLGVEPGAEDVSAYASPARCTDLSGLPPTWLGVGTLDLFHDEDLAFVGRLQAAGVEARALVVPGAFHGFDALRGTDVVRQFAAEQVRVLRAALAVRDPG